MKTLYQITVRTTNRCNSRCGHCDLWKKTDTEFKKEQFEDFCKELSEKYKTKIFCLCGGEPFLREDLSELVAIVRKYFTCSIVTATNGLLSERITEMNKLIKFDAICISLDGINTHKMIRGFDYKFVLKTADMLKNDTNFILITPTITKLNIEEIPKLIEIGEKYSGVFFSIYREDKFFENKINKALILDDRDKERVIELLEPHKNYLAVWSLLRYLKGKTFPFAAKKTLFFDNKLQPLPLPTIDIFEPISVSAGWNLLWKLMWKMDVNLSL